MSSGSLQARQRQVRNGESGVYFAGWGIVCEWPAWCDEAWSDCCQAQENVQRQNTGLEVVAAGTSDYQSNLQLSLIAFPLTLWEVWKWCYMTTGCWNSCKWEPVAMCPDCNHVTVRNAVMARTFRISCNFPFLSLS